MFKAFVKKPTPASHQLFAEDGLERLETHEGYRSASPFPHIVIDGLFEPEALRDVLAEWPTQDAAVEAHNDGVFVRKKIGTTWQTRFGPKTLAYFAELNGARLSPSIGMAMYPIDGYSGEELIAAACASMAAGKHSDPGAAPQAA